MVSPVLPELLPPATAVAEIAAQTETAPAIQQPHPSASPKPAAVQAPVQKTTARGPKIPAILLEGDEPSETSSAVIQKYSLGPRAAPPERPSTPAPLARQPSAGAQDQPPIAQVPSGSLHLMARDPHSLFASWSLDQSPETLRVSRLHHLVLRVRAENIPGLQSETDIKPEWRHVFLTVPRANESYVGELGCFAPGGEWRLIATSVAVRTPPEEPSEDRSILFATVAPPTAPAVSTRGPESVPPVAPRFSAELAQPFETSRAATPKAPPTRIPAAPVQPAAMSYVSEPTNGWSRAQEQALEQLISQAGYRQQQVGSIELAEIRPGAVERPLRVAAPAAAFLPEAITSPGAPPPQGISSAELPLQGPPRGRAFWFNINAELIIYGATEPDATVTIAGRPIRLRQDGTFSYRFALPDGTYDLPVAANSIDGETRRAELQFRRDTSYSGEVGAHPQDRALKPPVPPV